MGIGIEAFKVLFLSILAKPYLNHYPKDFPYNDLMRHHHPSLWTKIKWIFQKNLYSNKSFSVEWIPSPTTIHNLETLLANLISIPSPPLPQLYNHFFVSNIHMKKMCEAVIDQVWWEKGSKICKGPRKSLPGEWNCRKGDSELERFRRGDEWKI